MTLPGSLRRAALAAWSGRARPRAVVAAGGFAAGLLSISAAGADQRLVPIASCDGWSFFKWQSSGRTRYHWCTEQEITTIATLINYCIDLDHFSEDEEQKIFEHAVANCVDAISHVLPEPYALLVAQSGAGTGLDDKMAHALSNRLVRYVRSEVPLPYLDKDDEKMLVQCVVALVCESMRVSHRIEVVCQPENAAEVIVNVFMKGPIGVLFEEEERAQLVDTVIGNIKDVPFVPEAVMVRLLNLAIDWVAAHFEEALFGAYREHMMCITLDKLRQHLEQEHETLEHGYARFDLNGNGALDPEEMRVVLVEIGLPLGLKEQRRLCEELDRDGDHLIEIEEIKEAMSKSQILMAPYHGMQMDKEFLSLLEEELGCKEAARKLEPEMAGRVDAGETDGALPPLPTAAKVPTDKASTEGDGVEGEGTEPAEPIADEFHRGEQFVRRVRQRCLALLMRDCGGGEGNLEQSWTSWIAHTTLSASTRASLLLRLIDLVLTSIDTKKLEGVVQRFH
eukprot:COSAG02_NODE_3469_length_6691_cov_9.305218_8_plen_508_part_00